MQRSGGLLVALAALATTAMAFALAPAAREVTEVTKVEGRLPVDLRGVWLMYGRFDPPVSRHHLARLYEVTGEGDGLHVHLLRAKLPGPRAAGSVEPPAEGAERWPPGDYVARWRRTWWRLPDTGPVGYRSIEYRLVAAGAYDRALREDETARGSTFALVVKARYEPSGGPSQQVASVYAARRSAGDLVEGRFVQGTVVAAPFPIPIAFKGSFRLYRLARPGEQAWLRSLLVAWRRLEGALAGCGRRGPAAGKVSDSRRGSRARP